VDTYSASVKFVLEDGNEWWFTGVYGPNLDADKLHFLQELRDIRAGCPGPWLIGGDFNLIYRSADKNNPNVDRAMMGRFRRLINELELQELELLGRHFTWSNERDAPTLVRLDRVLCSSSWGQLFPDSLLQSTAAGISDHCPLVLGLRDNVRGRGRFHFENFRPSLDGFLEVVDTTWASPVPGICPFEQLAAKFKGLTIALQSWSQKMVGNVNSKLRQARELLHQFDIAQDLRSLSDQEAWLRRRLKQHCLTLASLQRTIARVRSSISWIQKGDANTAFFHSHARFRKRKNFIAKLQVDGNMVFSQEEKEQAVWDFYNGLLGTHAP